MKLGKLVSNAELVSKPDKNSGKTLKKFQKIIEEKYRVQFSDFWNFQSWSVENYEEFWSELWDFCGLIYSKKFDKVVDGKDFSGQLDWFPGAKLNFAENLLKFKDDQVAMILAGEDREHEKVTYSEMYEEAKLYTSAFRKFGLKKGDVVVAYVSNRKEAIFTMHAVLAIGAIMAGVIPLLGPEAVLNRIQQISPKVLLTIDRYRNEGNEIEMLCKVKKVTEGVPSLEKVLIIPSKEISKSKDISFIKNSCFLDDFLMMGKERDNTVPPLIFEQVFLSHPVFINYTSGTTGIPKALVHGSSILLTLFRDFVMHIDSKPGSIWLTLSPPGWVTWGCFATLHSLKMTLVLFEGVPYYLSPTYFWNMVEEFKITHIFPTSSVIDGFQRRGYLPQCENQLKSLEVFLTGGTVVKSQNYDFVYRKLKKDIKFSSNYGSTEFSSCCILMESTLPIYKEEIPALALGVDIKIVDKAGNELIGEYGELVVCTPMPNLPVCLWGDTDRLLYQKIYFTKYPGKFATGDYGIRNPVTKGIKVCCRCDEVLNQHGFRMGSSEIYNVVEKIIEVQDSICTSQYSQSGDVRTVLFLKMKKGHVFNEQFATTVRETITKELADFYAPEIIVEAADIPYNVNGKKMEIILKKIINNLPYSMDTIKNPESLKYFLNLSIPREF